MSKNKTENREVSPPGWEGTVQGMKSHPEISNPFALAWFMKDQGYTSHEAAGKVLEGYEKFKKAKAKEGGSQSSMGQLNRPGARKAGIKEVKAGFKFLSSLREAGTPNDDTREVPVTIIKEGLGNQRDKHFYTKDALNQAAVKFNGAKCYADHPTKFEETNRPERSIRDIVGYYKECKYVEQDGQGRITAILKINDGPHYEWAWDMLKEAIAFAHEFPNKDYVGISINAAGVTHQGEDDETKDIIHFVDSINQIVSADIVTEAGAGGGINGLKEAVALLESAGKGRSKIMGKALKAACEALAKVRGSMKEVKEDDEMYGGALDEIIDQLQKLAGEGGDENPGSGTDGEEAAGDPPATKSKPGDKPASAPGKPGTEEPAAEDMEAETAYKEGKMTPREKKIYESMLAERSKTAIMESNKLVEKKLKESAIPEKFIGDLKVVLVGKTDKEMDALIEARKAFIAGLHEDRATGAGSKVGSGEPSKLRESLAGAGVPLKEKK